MPFGGAGHLGDQIIHAPGSQIFWQLHVLYVAWLLPTLRIISLRYAVMARKSSLFHSSERFVALEEVLKWLEEVLNLPPNFSPFLLNT